MPTITDENELLEEMAKFISKFDNVEMVEILPYHTLGVFKYKELGIDYPLKDIEDLGYERKVEIMEMFKSITSLSTKKNAFFLKR